MGDVSSRPIEQVLEAWRARGVTIRLAGDRLRVSAPKGALSDGDRAELARRKADILAALARAPLTAAQRRLWFVQELERSDANYHVPLLLRLDGELDGPAFAERCARAVQRHRVLRSRFVDEGGEPIQVEGDAPDLEQCEASSVEEALEIARRAAVRPFALDREPPLRWGLVRVAPDVHVFHAVAHHIAMDGWSLGLLARELSQDTELEPLPLQVADVAREEPEASDEAREHWRRTLEDARPTELPARRSAGHRAAIRAGRVRGRVPEDVVRELEAWSRADGTTLYTVLAAAFAALLRRFSGEQEQLFGVPVSTRTRAEHEDLIGCFVNLLPLRTHLTGSESLEEAVAHLRELTRAAFAHAEVPYQDMVESRGIDLVRVLFALDDTLPDVLRIPGVSVTALDPEPPTARFELEWHLTRVPDGLAIEVDFDERRYDTAFVEQLVRCFVRLLGSERGTPVDVLPLVDESERRERQRLGAPAAPSAARGTLERIEEQVRARPDALAVDDWTYRRLWDRSGAIACAIGWRREAVVGVCVERGPELVAALLGVWRSGAAYLPLDPSFPPERLDALLADSGADALVTQHDLRDGWPGFHGDVIALEGVGPADTWSSEWADLDDLAYVIYTSGSTGRPKGVEVSHRALASFLDAMSREPGLGTGDVLLAVTTVAFDIAALELFGPLVVGGRVQVAAREDATDAHRLLEELRTRGATVVQATPATWQQLVDAGWRGEAPLRVLCGGEAMPRALAEALLARGAEVWNLYGPTEATVWTSVLRLVEPPRGPFAALGRPIPGMGWCVLGEDLEPVPRGAPGELCLFGAGLARGYRDRPELTNAAFVPCTWAPGGRLYRTGDLALEDERGGVRFLGRRDQQLKLHGFRIEPGEIEATLERRDDVRRAVVLLRDERLVGYVVAEGAVDTGELRADLARTLPEYMVPSAFVVLGALPLSPSGKVDRRRLASVAPQGATEPSRSPRTPTERELARVFAELLEREVAGVGDDFFELGGHSLLATRLVSRLRSLFEIELPLSAVFEARTVDELADRVDAARARGLSRPLPPIAPAGRGGPLPLSFAQRRLWVLEQMGAGEAYHLKLDLALRGALDVEALQGALDRLVERHEVLRTRFVSANGVPAQEVLEATPFPLADGAAQDLPELDLESGVVARARLVRRSEADHALHLELHHIAVDGWSFGILVRELCEHYAARVEGREPQVPDLPVQYADFAVWQRDQVTDEALASHLEAWRVRLDGELAPLGLPTDHPRPAVQTFGARTVHVDFGAELSRDLHRAAAQHGVTLFQLLFTAFQCLLARHAGQEEVVLGTPVANRTRVELEDLLGFFVNSLVLRGDLSGDPSFADMLARNKKLTLEAYDHQDLPFERLVDELDTERDLSRTPIFQHVFALHELSRFEPEGGGLRFGVLESEATVTRYDLELHAFETRERITCDLLGNRDLFEADTLERLGSELRRLLGAAVARPETKVAALPLLEGAQRREVLERWNDTATDDEDQGGVHRAIEAWVRRTPDAVAVACGGEELTYRALDARANRLANALAAQGVTRGDLVGLCAERGLDLVVGMVGIWKAGAAYLPIDPAYPQERIAYLLADSKVGVLVVERRLEAGLPDHRARVVRFDGPEVHRAADTPPRVEVESTDLAYAIYTSGSTGKPKAALLEHKGLLNVHREQARLFGVGPGWRVLQFASPSFDAATFELVDALPKGATLVTGDRHQLLPGPDLLRFLREERIGIVTLPPTALAATPVAELPDLRVITVAGEACPRELVTRWAPGRRFFNLYGPTETTIWSSFAELQPGEDVHIGLPIANTRIDLLDAAGEPVPVGVPGELCIGGRGLARGYLNRPELTAERFTDDPHRPGERLYRTGDLARRRRDGALEFAGRIDTQVKLRGYRIEPGEVEAVLDGHAGVQQSLVVAREDEPGDRRLVAYVVPQRDREADAVLEREHVDRWRTLYEDAYAQAPAADDPTFQITSWNSSYDGGPLPAEDMRAWVEGTVEAVLACEPTRVLEIGCGSGLILFRVAPHVAEYVGTDLSRAALDGVAGLLAAQGLGDGRVRLERREADDFEGVPEGHFDLVVLNSVVQYFPSGQHLADVLVRAARTLRPGGKLFVGDVRSLPLGTAFHTDVALHQAGESFDARAIATRARELAELDQELLLHPGFFAGLRARLPRLSRIACALKPGGYENELSRFRYDVVLTLDGVRAADATVDVVDAGVEVWDLARVDARLRERPGDPLVLRHLANQRTRAAAWTVDRIAGANPPETRAELDARLREQSAGAPAFEPVELRELARRHACRVAVGWTSGDEEGRFDAAFVRDGDPWDLLPGPEPVGLEHATNHPLAARFARELVPALRARVSAELPAYLVPSAFVVLDAFPLTPNGKIDRRALPEPESRPAPQATDREPLATETERTLASIWSLVLRREVAGADANFFEHGGDSILAIQVVAKAREAGLRMEARDLFQHPDLGGLARALDAGSGPHVDVDQGTVTGSAPLTPIQDWFFELGLARPGWFDQGVLLECEPHPDPAALEEALERVARHNDQLRARFRQGTDCVVQEYTGTAPLWPLERCELPAQDQEAFVERTCTAARSAFDLEHGPLARAVLFRSSTAGPDLLFLAIHHLCVDAVSWGILLADLERALEGRPLPAKTTSFATWARRQAAETFPILAPSMDPATRSAASCEVRADARAIESALVPAVARLVAELTGTEHVRVVHERHGRDTDDRGVDLSRTVGWFTRLESIAFRVPSAGAGEPRRLEDEAPGRSAAVAGLNYLGRVDALAGTARRFTLCDAPAGPASSPDNARPFPIDVQAHSTDGRLHVTVTCDTCSGGERAAERLCELALRELAEPSAIAGDWDEDELSELLSELGE